MQPTKDHNTHKTLRQIIAVNAWFVRREDNDRRYSLHASSAFDEERLGGGRESNVIFRVSIRRCEIVILPPIGSSFVIDPASVKGTKPRDNVAVQGNSSIKKSGGIRAGMGLTKGKFAPEFNASGAIERETAKSVTSNQPTNPFNELSKRSKDGHFAWRVDGKLLDDGRLSGSLWDGNEGPQLLTLIDQRSSEARVKDTLRNLTPNARIEVLCLREDIDIYDIQFKDPDRQKSFLSSRANAEKRLAAEMYLKHVILEEGLVAGDLADPFSEMKICDVSIPVLDNRTLDG